MISRNENSIGLGDHVHDKWGIMINDNWGIIIINDNYGSSTNDTNNNKRQYIIMIASMCTGANEI